MSEQVGINIYSLSQIQTTSLVARKKRILNLLCRCGEVALYSQTVIPYYFFKDCRLLVYKIYVFFALSSTLHSLLYIQLYQRTSMPQCSMIGLWQAQLKQMSWAFISKDRHGPYLPSGHLGSSLRPFWFHLCSQRLLGVRCSRVFSDSKKKPFWGRPSSSPRLLGF